MARALSNPPFDATKLDQAWAWTLPFLAALAYPHLLAYFFAHFHGPTPDAARAVLAMVLAFGVSAVGTVIAWRLRNARYPGVRSVTARRFAFLTVAAPPMFTFMGVLLYLMKIEGADIAVWTGLWVAAAALTTMLQLSRRDAPALMGGELLTDGQIGPGLGKLRFMHGVTAAALLVIFLAPHLINHLSAWLGTPTHVWMMLMLRKVYRNAWVEPAMLVVMAFQLLSGIALWLPKTRRATNLFDVIQLASGVYLLFFIASHVNSVFVLARHFGTDTNWEWAVAAPAGLAADAWNVRLIPHYAIGVFMLLAHLACGLRVVLLGHSTGVERSNKLTWIALAGALVTAVAISAAMLGARL